MRRGGPVIKWPSAIYSRFSCNQIPNANTIVRSGCHPARDRLDRYINIPNGRILSLPKDANTLAIMG